MSAPTVSPTPSPIEVAAARRQATRVMGTLWIAGAMLGALFILLPHPQEADETAMAVFSAIALLGGLLLLLSGARPPMWVLQIGVAAGTALIGVSFYSIGDANTGYAVLFAWPVVYSAFFFRTREMVAQLVFVAVVYAAALIARPVLGAEALSMWLYAVVGLAVVGAMMSVLIRQRTQSERARRHLAGIVRASTEPIVGASVAGEIESWNHGAEALLGYSPDEAVGRPVAWLLPADRHRELEEAFESLRTGTEIVDFETVWLHQGGGAINVSLTIAPVAGGDGSVIEASIVAHDISERKHLEEVSERLLAASEARARTDPLTGLANRRAWDEELRRELARAGRQGWPVCVAMLDLDHFKAFNDDRGHLAGDELLKESAATWTVVLRDGDFMARYGGEEFTVLLPNCSIGDAVQVIERLRTATPMGQTCSAGVARWEGSESATELLRRADGALYSAKRAGRDRLLTA